MRRDMAWAAAVFAAGVLLVVGPAQAAPTAILVVLAGWFTLARSWQARTVDRRMHRAGVVLTIEPDDVDGGWIVTSPSSVATQGETLGEATHRARHAFVAVERARKAGAR